MAGRPPDRRLDRDRPLDDLARTALLVVDVQYYVAAVGEGENAHFTADAVPEDRRYFFDRLRHVVLPNIRALQDALRAAGSEVLFATIESLTRDGRDRGLDHKISGIFVARGSRDAEVLAEVAPVGDEIRLAKTTSSVFASTAIDHVLRSLEVERLIVAGLLTDQCVVSAVRDACDRGYLVVAPEDACATYTQERHRSALALSSGYCRVTTTAALLGEIARLQQAPGARGLAP